MGAERGHRENGSEYCLLYLHLPDISFEQHALCFNGASSRTQPSHSQVSRALRPTSATWHVMPVRGPSVPREACFPEAASDEGYYCDDISVFGASC